MSAAFAHRSGRSAGRGRLFASDRALVQTARLPELPRLVRMLEEPLSASLRERNIYLLKKVVKACQNGFLLREIDDILKIMNLCADKLTEDPQYTSILRDLLQICSRPFLKEKLTDERTFVEVVTECVSQIGLLLRVPANEVRLQICSTIAAFYHRQKHTAALDGVCATSADFRALMVERSGVAETLVMSLGGMEENLSVTLRVLQTLQILSRASDVNCGVMLRAGAAEKICLRMSETDPSGQVLFRCSDILWNLLEKVGTAEVISQLSGRECVTSLRDAFLQQLQDGSAQLRNDLLVLTSLIAPNASLIETGFARYLVMLAKFPEHTLSTSRSSLSRELKISDLSSSHEDYEMKKLLLNMMVLLSEDPAALQLFEEVQLMPALMLLIKPGAEWSAAERSGGQQEELQLQALAALGTLAPRMATDYMSCQGNTCLLLLLDWCLQPGPGDSSSSHTRGFHGGSEDYMRYCVRALRSMVCVNQAVRQDLCDQNAIGQMLRVLRCLAERQESGGIVSLEIHTDCLFVLSVLCDEDTHRKELFGADGVDVLVRYLSLDPVLVFSGLGHNKLLLSTVECVWSCVVGCIGTEDVFLDRRGAHLLLQLLQTGQRNLHDVIVGTLLELCENSLALKQVLQWRGDGDVTLSQMLLQMWRKEEQDTGRTIADVGIHQPSNSRIALKDVSENLRANIYCFFIKLGIQQQSSLNTEDLLTLTLIHYYLDFKVMEVWSEVIAQLCVEGVQLVQCDEECVELMTRVSADLQQRVVCVQDAVQERQQERQLQQEARHYSQILLDREQRVIAAEAWFHYVTRISNYSQLKISSSGPEPCAETSKTAEDPK